MRSGRYRYRRKKEKMAELAHKSKRGSLIIMMNGEIITKKLIKDKTFIGRITNSPDIDIQLDRPVLSKAHGVIFRENGKYYYGDNNSTNGSIVDGQYIKNGVAPLNESSVIEIKSHNENFGVLILFSMFDYSRQKWQSRNLYDGSSDPIYIGRMVGQNDISIPSVQISRQHGVFTRNGNDWIYQDLNSKNGTFINRKLVVKPTILRENDIIQIVNVKLIFARGMLIYNLPNAGCELKVDNISKMVKCPKTDPSYKKSPNHKKCILDRVNVTIEPSEFVAVLGGSGAGKTTFLNCINGYEEATSGAVYMDGINLYEHKDSLKKQIGYVPQEDLLRNGISVRQTLRYIAKMRLPKDVDKKEREKRIDHTFDMLGLDAKCQASDVKKVSGGQRKRVSIASELVSDPPILFLDEPTSGLDPETETNLIKSLQELAHTHEKTVIVITHTLKNIDLFDKVLFFAPGGKLCFAGPPEEAYELFKVSDMTDVYKIVREYTDEFDAYYRQTNN